MLKEKKKKKKKKKKKVGLMKRTKPKRRREQKDDDDEKMRMTCRIFVRFKSARPVSTVDTASRKQMRGDIPRGSINRPGRAYKVNFLFFVVEFHSACQPPPASPGNKKRRTTLQTQ